MQRVPKPSTAPANGRPPRLHFTCLLPENFPLWERMALLVQRDLAADRRRYAARDRCRIDEVQPSDLATGDFDAVLLELIVGNSASRPFSFWHSSSKQNVWGYQNPTVDDAFDGIRRAANDAEYRDAFRQFQQQNARRSPGIFLALGETTRA